MTFTICLSSLNCFSVEQTRETSLDYKLAAARIIDIYISTYAIGIYVTFVLLIAFMNTRNVNTLTQGRRQATCNQGLEELMRRFTGIYKKCDTIRFVFNMYNNFFHVLSFHILQLPSILSVAMFTANTLNKRNDFLDTGCADNSARNLGLHSATPAAALHAALA